jgi:hypothetical protein
VNLFGTLFDLTGLALVACQSFQAMGANFECCQGQAWAEPRAGAQGRGQGRGQRQSRAKGRVRLLCWLCQASEKYLPRKGKNYYPRNLLWKKTRGCKANLFCTECRRGSCGDNYFYWGCSILKIQQRISKTSKTTHFTVACDLWWCVTFDLCSALNLWRSMVLNLGGL